MAQFKTAAMGSEKLPTSDLALDPRHSGSELKCRLSILLNAELSEFTRKLLTGVDSTSNSGSSNMTLEIIFPDLHPQLEDACDIL